MYIFLLYHSLPLLPLYKTLKMCDVFMNTKRFPRENRRGKDRRIICFFEK